MSHAVSTSRSTRLLQDAPADDHATRALFSGAAFCDEVLPYGTILNASYEITRVLGRGGFGVTYEARDENSGNVFAIKEFFPPGCVRVGGEVVAGAAQTAQRLAASRRRFVEEARVLSALRHPNLVRVFGAFQERGTAFLVMEKLRGATLLEIVESRGALPEPLVLSRRGKVVRGARCVASRRVFASRCEAGKRLRLRLRRRRKTPHRLDGLRFVAPHRRPNRAHHAAADSRDALRNARLRAGRAVFAKRDSCREKPIFTRSARRSFTFSPATRRRLPPSAPLRVQNFPVPITKRCLRVLATHFRWRCKRVRATVRLRCVILEACCAAKK